MCLQFQILIFSNLNTFAHLSKLSFLCCHKLSADDTSFSPKFSNGGSIQLFTINWRSKKFRQKTRTLTLPLLRLYYYCVPSKFVLSSLLALHSVSALEQLNEKTSTVSSWSHGMPDLLALIILTIVTKDNGYAWPSLNKQFISSLQHKLLLH